MQIMKTSPRVNLWPISIISFFSVAILGCITFVTFCSRHPADLISPNYYEDEVKYQGHIDRLQQTRERASLASVSYDTGTRTIMVSIPSEIAAGNPTGQIQLYRPSALNQDQLVKLELDARGRQTLNAAKLLPGLWKIRVSWTVAEHQYFIDQRLVVPSAVM
jgi:hypothetical protein